MTFRFVPRAALRENWSAKQLVATHRVSLLLVRSQTQASPNESEEGRFHQGSVFDRWFLRELLVVSILVEVSLRVLGLARTQRLVARLTCGLRPRHIAVMDYSREQSALLHEERVSSSLPWKPTCLRRALAQLWTLRRCGDRGPLCVAFGTRTNEGDQREFHAWLERSGQPVCDFPQLIHTYARLRNG
jgi:hypothetical protein